MIISNASSRISIRTFIAIQRMPTYRQGCSMPLPMGQSRGSLVQLARAIPTIHSRTHIAQSPEQLYTRMCIQRQRVSYMTVKWMLFMDAAIGISTLNEDGRLCSHGDHLASTMNMDRRVWIEYLPVIQDP